jgi:hypothetical protein
MQIKMPQLVHGKVSENSVQGLQKFRDEKYLDKDSSASTKTKQEPCSEECLVPAEPGLCSKGNRASSCWVHRLRWSVSLHASGMILAVDCKQANRDKASL